MLSSKSMKAAEVLVMIAARTPGTPLTTREMAQRLGVSVGYLEVILGVLRQHDLVLAYRGPGGGYQFNPRPAGLGHEPQLWDVVRLFERRPETGLHLLSSVEQALWSHVQAFCEAHSIRELAADLEPEPPLPTTVRNDFKLKPLAPTPLPRGARSVFDWAGVQGAAVLEPV